MERKRLGTLASWPSAMAEISYRPLVPALAFLMGGIALGHKTSSLCQGALPVLFLATMTCLIGTLFLSEGSRTLCLLLSFFLTGILLDLNNHRSSQLLPYAMQGRSTTIEGTVLEPAKVIKDMARLKVRVEKLIIGGRTRLINDILLVNVYDYIRLIQPGERIRFRAKLSALKNFNNPGGYDYVTAMKLRGISCSATVSDGRGLVPLGRGALPFPSQILEKFQRPIRRFFNHNLNAQDDALMRALILGERQGICPELREPFNRTGLGHVLAVSGLHIGLVASACFILFKSILSWSYRLALRTDIRKWAASLACLPVVGYSCLAGFQVSCQRAMIMVLAFIFSLILNREKEIWSTLALAALLILAIDPHALFSVSFQLSFSAVIGILWLSPIFLRRMPITDNINKKGEKIFNRINNYFIALLAISLSALIFLIPIVAYYFHRISAVTIPANMCVVPILGFWVIPLGLCSAFLLPVSGQVAQIALVLCTWGLHMMREIVGFWSHFSWSSFWIITPNLYEMVIFFMIILLVSCLKRWPWAKAGLWITAVLILIDVGYWTYRVRFNRYLTVTFLDVGQGSATLVEFPGGKKMLIDGGGFPRDQFDVGRMVVAPYLWHSKICHVDYLVLSHPQADHMNGLRFIARNFHPKEFWYNGDSVDRRPFRELMAITRSKGIKRLVPADLEKGRHFKDVKVEVMHPEPNDSSRKFFGNSGRLNNNSLVLKISYAGKSFLFPGDLEQSGEAALVSRAGHTLRSDILLSPHHGSKGSNSKAFLEMVRPRYCVISSGKGNVFGFPHAQTLARIKDVGCRVIRIQKSGAVQFRVGPQVFEIKAFLENTAL